MIWVKELELPSCETLNNWKMGQYSIEWRWWGGSVCLVCVSEVDWVRLFVLQEGAEGVATRMLACPMCAKVFHGTKRKYRLDRHMLVHWGLKPFKCPHCPYRSTQQNNLNRHIKNVHWQIAEPVSECGENIGNLVQKPESPLQELQEECCSSPQKSEEVTLSCMTMSQCRKVL